MYMLIRWKRKK